MSHQSLRRARAALLLLPLLLLATVGRAAPWLPYGPDGGDARALAVDPANHAHLFLGTANGWMYESSDTGRAWKRLARIGKRDDLVVDNILVDPANSKHLIVGAWVLDRIDGGIFSSADGGLTWTDAPQMRGRSIRALTVAPSDPKIMIAGTAGMQSGVFRSADSGATWEQISPAESREIHNVESIAIDPIDPKIIYAGTWHLPWKTVDGGANWVNIKQGIIEDSDVFSIIVDPKKANVVFASACSGIYKSEDGGGLFKKIQGIPATARRTRVLMQDPTHLDTVFAGTTEGLWRTTDAGKTWMRTTGPEVIVNDVYVDPTEAGRVLLATDRGGVLTSSDGGSSFSPSNTGFSARQITAILNDPQKPGTLYVGVVNDKQWGGVYFSEDGGLTWTQTSVGLNGGDVFSLGESADGTVLAGTAHGIFRLADGRWTPTVGVPVLVAASDSVAKESAPAGRGTSRPKSPAASSGKVPVRAGATHVAAVAANHRRAKAIAAKAPSPPAPPAGFDGGVHAIVAAGDRMYAGTSSGLLMSLDAGRSWRPVPGLGDAEWRYVAAGRGAIAAASLNGMKVSADGGENWMETTLPASLTQVSALAVDDRGEIWLGSREGVFLSSDKGATWQTLRNLYVRNVDNLYFDDSTGQVMVASSGEATVAYAVHVADRKVSYWETGWSLRFLRRVGDHLLGATLFDGVVIQPRMVESKETSGQ